MTTIFDPAELHEIAQAAVGLEFDEMCRVVIDGVAQRYPDHVETHPEWVFSLAAGSTAIMNILHASLTEYLIIYGTPIGTEAFSGRYTLDIHDFLLSGAMKTYKAHDPGHALVTEAGGRAVHHPGEVNGFVFEPNTWALEYGRGFVPSALHTTLGDLIFRALDPKLIVQTFGAYGRLTIKELLRGKF